MRIRQLFVFVALGVCVAVLFSAGRVVADQKTGALDGRVRSSCASKAVPDQLNYQGFLVDSADSSAVTATLEMTFRLFDSESNGTELWSETHSAVDVMSGLFQVLLGSVTPFPAGLFDGTQLWLQTEVGVEVLAPRKPCVSVAYSHRANSAEMILDYTLTDLDSRWVNEDQASSVTGSMITDGEITDDDISATAAIDAAKIDDGPGSGLDADLLDGMEGTAFAAVAHQHDDRYYTEDELSTAGTINDPSNPVDWTKLKGVPAGFADGADDVGGAGGITQILEGDGIDVTDPTGPTATVAAEFGTGSTQVARGNHDHDADYVNEGQASSITSAMITNGQIVNDDISVGAAIDPAKISGTAWTSANDGSGSGLDADLLDGQQASAFLTTASDYGRSGVSANLYEGATALSDKYVNQNDLDHLDAADGAPANAVYVDAAGNVGIGTTVPDYKLDVNGNAGFNDYIYHNGDTDTYLFFSDDQCDMYAGAVRMLTADETTQDVVVINENGADVDFRIESNNNASALFVQGSDGRVGIGTSTPEGGMEVDITGSYARVQAKGTAGVTGFWIDKPSAAENSYVVYQTANIDRWVAGCMADDNYRIRYWPTGKDLLYCTSTGNVGIGTTSPNYALEVVGSSGHNGYMGGLSYAVYGSHASGNYGYIGGAYRGMYAEMASAGLGDYAIYGDGTDAAGEDGTGYGIGDNLGGVEGYNYWGNPYTFGVAGYSYLDYNRSGGCFGGRDDANVWGAIGYKNSSGTQYGGYFTNWTTGSGKGEASVGIGLGSWGELFGADIHGKVYGLYAEGSNYGLYSHGAVFRDDLDVHLQRAKNNSTSVLYTNVSTDVTVQTSGYCTLSRGRCTIEFDENFKNVVSPEVPVVVTVTPVGSSNGVYVSEVKSNGFTVVENNNGKSDVQIAFIAIGRRAGYESPYLPQEVVSTDYIEKLSRGLHNDADVSTDGEGLYYENGQLNVGIHPSALPRSDKPREENEEKDELMLRQKEGPRRAMEAQVVGSTEDPTRRVTR